MTTLSPSSVSHEYSPFRTLQKPSLRRHTEFPSSSIESIKLPPSPADSGITIQHDGVDGTGSATLREQKRITREIKRGTPGDRTDAPIFKSPAQQEVARKRSQYYESAFATREPSITARDRIVQESMIVAEIKTNVMIQDEYTVITDLSYAISTRYQRPASSILVSVTHSCCLLFGGTFDPAYILTITALPSQLQPVTNKRNAALLARSMEEALRVAPDRGVIKFRTIAEENLAHNCNTVAGNIEELEREHAEIHGVQRSVSRKTKRKLSIKSLGGHRASSLPTHDESNASSPTPPRTLSSACDSPTLPDLPSEKIIMEDQLGKRAMRPMGRHRSLLAAFLGRH